MPIQHLLITISCVLALSVGQILFKKVAIEMAAAGTWIHPRVLMFTVLAFFIYGVTTLAWIYVLRFVELNRAYPVMALSFVAVPLMGYLFYGEMVGSYYFIGVALIIGGIVVITSLS